jgi:hypothetical protein
MTLKQVHTHQFILDMGHPSSTFYKKAHSFTTMHAGWYIGIHTINFLLCMHFDKHLTGGNKVAE